MKPEEFVDSLKEHAYEYVKECLENKKEAVSGSGKVVKVKDRHIPTVQYFLMVWCPMNKGQKMNRTTWYKWLKMEESEQFTDQRNALIRKKNNTIKEIDELFNSVASDIVANEGKGIFYAKNKLGMSDKVDTNVKHEVKTITGMKIINEQKSLEDASDKRNS